MNIYYGFTISEFVGLVVGGITLVVFLVYYGISAIIRAWKSRRAPRAMGGYNEPPAEVIPPKRVPPAPPSVKSRRR